MSAGSGRPRLGAPAAAVVALLSAALGPRVAAAGPPVHRIEPGPAAAPAAADADEPAAAAPGDSGLPAGDPEGGGGNDAEGAEGADPDAGGAAAGADPAAGGPPSPAPEPAPPAAPGPGGPKEIRFAVPTLDTDPCGRGVPGSADLDAFFAAAPAPGPAAQVLALAQASPSCARRARGLNRAELERQLAAAGPAPATPVLARLLRDWAVGWRRLEGCVHGLAGGRGLPRLPPLCAPSPCWEVRVAGRARGPCRAP